MRGADSPYRLLFEDHPSPMWVFNVNTLGFVRVNQAAIKCYGYSSEDFLSMTVEALHLPEEIPALRRAIAQLATSPGYAGIRPAGVWSHHKKAGGLIKVELLWHRLLSDRSLALAVIQEVSKRGRSQKTRYSGKSQVDGARETLYLASLAIENARLVEQVHRSQESLKALSRRLLEAQEGERRLLALELHDDIGQALTAVKLSLRGMQGKPREQADSRSNEKTDSTPRDRHLNEALQLVDDALQRVRNLALDLRPSLLDDFGLVAAIRWLIDRYATRVGVSVHLKVDPLEERLNPECEIGCFRIAQEALTNIMKHAKAQQVWVQLRKREGALHLLIRDDGVGFDVQESLKVARHGTSVGLLGMRERAGLLGGHCEILSRPGHGTIVRARIPVTPDGGEFPAELPDTLSSLTQFGAQQPLRLLQVDNPSRERLARNRPLGVRRQKAAASRPIILP